jgi:transposase-like protein
MTGNINCEINNTLSEGALEAIMRYGMEGLPRAIEILYNEAMKIERSRHLGFERYEHSAERSDYANGYKSRKLKTRAGELNLQVPQVRNGDFYPSFLEKGLRSERALKATLAEMYIQGVSTRKVSAVIEQLCGFQVTSTDVSRATGLLDEEFKKWRARPLRKYEYLYLDARYEKVRNAGSVTDLATLIAIGATEEGKVELLGISVKLSEAEIHWREFLNDLQKRGLHGVKLIISDDHSGLKAARKTVLPSVLWQRCQFHLQQNAQKYVPKKSMKKEVATDIRGIFNASNREEANRLLKINIEKYQSTAPQLSKWMDDSIAEGLTVFAFPEEYRKHIRTNNIAERVNKEIKRRTRKVGIFPNEDSCLRLSTAIVMEISEEWLMGKRYLPKIES